MAQPGTGPNLISVGIIVVYQLSAISYQLSASGFRRRLANRASLPQLVAES
jgi:hypothetical protein